MRRNLCRPVWNIPPLRPELGAADGSAPFQAFDNPGNVFLDEEKIDLLRGSAAISIMNYEG